MLCIGLVRICGGANIVKVGEGRVEERKLSWEQARKEWTDAHREKYEKFLIDTLSFPDATSPGEPPAEGQSVSAAAKMLAKLPHTTGG